MTDAGLPPAAGVEDAERALRDACGITLTEGLRVTLGEAIRRAARATGLELDAFRARLRARDARCLAELVEAAVVGETYFFRHPEQLEAVREVLLLRAPRERPLRIWSAGCATGEEPYSLAMLLLDAGRAGCRDRILGTDVSTRALAVAAEGVYGAWSLRRIEPAARARHFEGAPPQVRVREEVRAAVELRRHNLYSDVAPPGPFDLVVCRNVLIYFERQTAREIAARLLDAVSPGGVLLLGPVELPLADGFEAERIEVGGTTLLRRRAAGSFESVATSGRRRQGWEKRGRGNPSPNANPILHPYPTPTPTSTSTRIASASAAAAASASASASASAAATASASATASAAATASASASAAASASGAAAPTRTPARFEEALDAARRGETEFAEQLAREVAEQHLCPESYLLVAMAADARGDLGGAIDALRRALYLEPGLAMAHASLVPLYARMGRQDEAARARRNALEAVAGLDDAVPLRGVEPITAGALRSALGDPQRAPPGAGRSDA